MAPVSKRTCSSLRGSSCSQGEPLALCGALGGIGAGAGGSALIQSLLAGGAGLDFGAIAGNLVGGVAGAILSTVVGLIVNAVKKK